MDYLAVAVAGFIGAITRALLSSVISTEFYSPFPFSTLFINITGCLILSFFMNVTISHLKLNPNLRVGIGTGLLGAYTTFSTFSVESIMLFSNGTKLLAITYVFTTSLGCVASAWFGTVLSRFVIKTEDGTDVTMNNSTEG